ncbi:hypothetical protein CI238_10936 [Colletotrichum incanum]|uniref:Uncharacterized protein n=1 Tax=Colletotrichum incanum TaxID=1573173 RepID=A0A167C7B4_COLIC|nr:hypothetical protein CI238_10936 [Colletotrichum incanum]OHW93498.1 hypothetical protein CSPAE12_07937 [Colletotrichum incanum]
MQYSFVLFFIFSYLPALGLALPAASPAQGAGDRHHRFLARGVRRLGPRTPQNDVTQEQTGASQGQNNTAGGRNGVSETQITNAVMSWMQDTAKVTKFLNTATSFTGTEFTKQATIALNAEIDELNHKKVLDAALQGTDMVTQANAVLDTQGTFQQVVDTLQSMVTNGPDTAQKDVDSINNNRCVNVLPNIDMYFAAAGAPQIQAIRPTGCLEVEGANVTPAIPPPVNGGGANNGGAAAPQVTQAPSAGNGNENDQTQNGNGQSNNQNQGNNNNGQNIGKGATGNSGNNQGSNNGQDQTRGNGNQNQNQSKGNGNGNNSQGSNQNNSNNALQPAKLGSQNSKPRLNNGNGNNEGQRQSQQQSQQSPSQSGSSLQPAQLGSPRSGNN